MVNVISYVLPAIVASWIFTKLGSKENLLALITGTSLFMILIFLLNSSVLIWGFDYSHGVIDFSSTSLIFMVQYVLLSLFWAALLPFLLWNIKRNLNVRTKEKIIFKPIK